MVRVWVLAGDIVLCSWARHFTLTVPLSTQVYKWVPANLMLGVALRWTSIPSRGSRNTPSRFMLRKPGIGSGGWATDSKADFTLPLLHYNVVRCPKSRVVHRSYECFNIIWGEGRNRKRQRKKSTRCLYNDGSMNSKFSSFRPNLTSVPKSFDQDCS